VDTSTLERLTELVPVGGTTLETGVGESTVVFLSRSARHIAVAPDRRERDAITAFCSEHDIPVDSFEFLEGTSDRILPSLDLPRLDLVLIDGQHAFPAPFMDWYYTADQLRQGGLVVIDDVPIKTGTVLRDFLAAEPEWRLREETSRVAIFEKLIDGPVTGKWWLQQPWCHPDPDGGRSPMARLRSTVRLRSRLRTLVR
jgi:hypothetical protein